MSCAKRERCAVPEHSRHAPSVQFVAVGQADVPKINQSQAITEAAPHLLHPRIALYHGYCFRLAITRKRSIHLR